MFKFSSFRSLPNIYRPQMKFGSRNIFRSVSRILSTGGSLPQCMLGYPPGRRHPPGGRLPRGGTPPLSAEHAGRYGQRAGGTHPTGMQSCSIFNQTSSGSNLTSLKIIFCVLLADNSPNFRQKTW